ncbi:MAG: ABC transporter substrate-binding protein [Candidatus Caldatribacteriaceae bacterium]
MLRKSVFLVIGLVVLGLGFGAFAADKPIELNFISWSYGVETVKDNISKFEALYPNIKVNYSDFSWFDYHDIAVQRFLANTPTDVMYGSDHWLQEWAAANWIVPLEDYFPDFKNYEKEFAPYAVEGMTYQGELYGLPYYADMVVFLYNKEMLKKAGFDNPPQTLDELIEQSKVLKEKGICKYPLALCFAKNEGQSIEIFTSLVYSFANGNMFDADLNPLFEKDGAVYKALKFLYEALNTYEILDPASLTWGEIDLVKSFGAGNHTFTFVNKYNLAELNNPAVTNLAGQFSIALFPGETHSCVGFVRFYCMTNMAVKRGKDVIDACGKFLNYFGGKTDGTYVVPKRWALEKGLGFAQLPLYDDPEVVNAINQWGNVDIEKEQAKLARAKQGMTPFYGTWDIFMREQIHKALLKEIPIEDALSASAKYWNDLKQKFGKK